MKTLNKKLLTILLIATLAIVIYYAMLYGVGLSYSIIYIYVAENDGGMRSWISSRDFNRSIWLYFNHFLAYALGVTNIILALVENKTVNRVAVSFLYFLSIFWFWGRPIIDIWPRRAIPIFCILTFFYILNVLTARFIAKKLLDKDIL